MYGCCLGSQTVFAALSVPGSRVGEHELVGLMLDQVSLTPATTTFDSTNGHQTRQLVAPQILTFSGAQSSGQLELVGVVSPCGAELHGDRTFALWKQRSLSKLGTTPENWRTLQPST